MKKKHSKFSIFKIICLVCYIICAGVLIVESCINGTESANHSNAIGNTIAGIVNDLGGDKTVVIEPESLSITNKINKADIGDTYQIKTQTLPEDSTYKSIVYQSSDKSIASINEEGKVSFLKEGKVILTVYNEKVPEIKDFMEVDVKTVIATKMEAIIDNASLNNGIYTLYVENSNSYFVKYRLEPTNATNRKVKVNIDKKDYLDISSNGQLINLKDSKNELTNITLTCGSASTTLKILVETKNKVKLEDIDISLSKNEIYVSEQTLLNVNFKPDNATYKDYIITASNDNVTINQNMITGVKDGETILTLTSPENKQISKTIPLKILKQPSIDSFTLKSDSLNLIENQNTSIKFDNISPTIYSDLTSLNYESSNNDVVTIDESGNIHAVKKGTAIIKVSNNNISKQINVTVNEYVPPYEVKDNHIIGFKIANKEVTLPYSNQIDLNSIFKVNTWIYDTSLINTGDTNISFSLLNNSTNEINNNILKVNEIGKIDLLMMHVATGFNIEVSLIVLDSYSIVDENNNITSNINLNSTHSFHFKINAKNNDYKVVITDENNNKVDDPLLITNLDNSYTLKSIYGDGNYKLNIIPICNHIEYENYKTTIPINVSHILIEDIDYNIIDNKYNEIPLENNTLKMLVNQIYYVNVKVDSTVTKYDFSYSSSDSSIVSISTSGKITPKSIGEATITIIDEASNKQKSFKIVISNLIILDEDNKISITGTDSSYDDKTNTYIITNGHASNLKVNFDSKSTYKKATYISLNENIVSVGKDGTLTPFKTGETKIVVTIDDGMQEATVITINIKVNKQNLIKDLTDFLTKMRKAIGHFGAFLVLGIFSTFTYMLYIKRKKWDNAIIINMAQGFILAALTEYIQTFIPGRLGLLSDVLIDYLGFLISFIILTILIIRYYKKKYPIELVKNNKIKRIVNK